ncbi:glycosyltransferase family 4 protein [Priestia endophytica]|uniref:glycosyltransferase family 4 protein n=1 Tax=Priestia endophytica TaxID=135735 RepID=UPI000DCA8D77|nr:glycosyltransferase family 4 protein [Priestia endophytica]RAS79918.1 glycosyltransferase family 1 protein [Priestia endophytica]
MKKILLTATVQSHIAQFHLPLIKMLKDNGCKVHVAARDNLAEKNGLKIDGADKIFDISFERSPINKKNIKAYKQLKEIFSNNNYDIVHCNTPMGGVITRLAAKAARKNGTKVFYTAHGFHFYKGAPLKNWIVYYPIEKWLAKYTDKLITITNEDHELSTKKFKSDTYHVHGVGVNSKKYFLLNAEDRAALVNQLGYSQDQFLILCTGELNKNKNQSTLIKAIAEISKEYSNIKLLLAGNGPMEYELKSIVESLEISDLVDFLGYRTDLEKFVNVCDLVVSASFREGLPLNIMEAMLCRKPVIASINRGHKELVKNNVTGFLVNPFDEREFVSSILQLIRNKEQAISFGKNGFKFVQPFTEENVINDLIKIYELNSK